jgi:hypothetical protein
VAMTTEAAPAWLSAWREGRVAPPEPRPVEPVQTAPLVHTDQLGFTQPDEWPHDNGARREPVLDMDRTPPRVVRYVGWRSCLRCRRPYFSQDAQRVRLCDPCKDSSL